MEGVTMKKKILFIAPNLRISNGVTSFIMGNYFFLLENEYEVDFLLTRKVESPYNEIVENNGSRIFEYPNPENKFSILNGHYVRDLLKENSYDLVHCNVTGMYAYWAVMEADRAKISHIVYHAHNPKETTSIKGRLREEIFDRLCFIHTTDYIACTEHAGKSVFGTKKFYVVKNGVNFEKYRFDIEARKRIRRDLQIEDSIIVGTVCRQAEQKNPYFIIDIIRELNKSEKKYILLWVGTGPLEQKVREYAEHKRIAEKVVFLGNRQDTNKLYSAMDLFLLPSKYEGLGIVYLEAQANGLYCFASDVVPKETDITGNISYYKLSDSPVEWANQIVNKMKTANIDRNLVLNIVTKSDMELTSANKMLIQAYQQMEG